MDLFLKILAVALSAIVPLGATADTVVHTVYAAAALSQGGLQLEWESSPGGWKSANTLRHYDLRSGECSILLNHQQMFALQEMSRRGILSTTQVTEYAALGERISPRQISFFEQTHEGKTVATLWSISGQDYEGGLYTRILPWMMEKKWAALAKEIDRKKIPFLWEWGRAAQVTDGDIDSLISFATHKAVRELKALGGKVEDAAITIHAISPAHSLSYLKRFPGTQLSKNSVRDGDSILLIPLKDILKAHALSKNSALLGDLKRTLSDERFTDDILVGLVEAFRETLWRENEWKGLKKVSKAPLLIQDFSPWGVNSVHAMLRGSGVPETKSKAVIERLLEMPLTKRLRKGNRYFDATEAKGAAILSHENKAIEVTGLDPEQLSGDPFYLHRVLFSVAAQTVNQARKIAPTASIKEIWESLILRRTPIALATRNPEMARAIRALRPDQIKKWVTDAAPLDVPKEMVEALGDDWGTTTEVNFFTFGRILQMTMEDPRMDGIFNDSVDRMGRSYQIEYSLMDPDLF